MSYKKIEKTKIIKKLKQNKIKKRLIKYSLIIYAIQSSCIGNIFLYFVLMSGTCSEIMNCGLQRYIKHNNWIKHLMIFLSIYIFTFILNWYTLDSLIVENFNVMNFINEQPYLKRSLYYSIIIYVIFILSTKNEGKFLATFLFGSLALVFGTIYTKTINTDIFKDVQKKYITMGSDIQELKKNILK